jgi:CHAT domain-containing protein/Flp pilus assembly protein TadD
LKVLLQLIVGVSLALGLLQTSVAQMEPVALVVKETAGVFDENGNELRKIEPGVVVKKVAEKGDLSEVEFFYLHLRSKTLFMPTKSLRPCDHADVAKTKENFNSVLLQVRKLRNDSFEKAGAGKWAESLELIEQVHALMNGLVGETSEYTLFDLKLCVERATHAGQLNKAQRYAETMLSDTEIAFGDDSLYTGMALNVLGLVEYRLANFELAASLIQKAIAVHEKADGPRTLDTLEVRCDLGFVYFEQGKLDEAQKVFQDVLEIVLQVDPNDQLRATCQFNLAAISAQRSDFRTARSLLQQAMFKFEETTSDRKIAEPKPVRNLWESMDRLVGVMLSLGEYQDALHFSRYLLEGKLKIWGPEHLTVGREYESIAAVEALFTDAFTGIEHYEQAIKIYDLNTGKQNLDSARVQTKLANLQILLGRFDEAKVNLSQAIKSVEAKLGSTSARLVAPLTALGMAHLGVHELPQAIEVLSRALVIAQTEYGAQHPLTVETQRALGIGYVAAGQWDQAIQQIDQTKRNEHDFIWSTLPYCDWRQQEIYFRENSRANMESDLGWVEHAAKHPALVEQTLEWILNYKSVATEIRGTQQRMLNQQVDAQNQADVQKLLKLKQEIAKIQMTDSSKLTNQYMDSMLQQERELLDRVTKDVNFSLSVPDWITVSEFRKSIPADSVYLEIARFTDQPLTGEIPQKPDAHYGIWIVWPDDKKPIEFFKISSCANFDRDLAALLMLIRSLDGSRAERALQIGLQSFFQDHLQTCFSQIADVKQVVICPDTTMWLVPWSALMVDSKQFMVERHAVTLCMSGRDLQRAPSPGTARKSVIVADPDFDHAFSKVQRRRQVLLEDVQADRLSGTRLEAKLIAPAIENYTGSSPVVVMDQDANETKIKLLNNPQVLTFATHGFFLAKNPVVSRVHSKATYQTLKEMGLYVEDPLTQCGLMLAGCNQGYSGDDKSILNDGVLTGIEILNLKLNNTELVVLSACETGLGKVTVGEGIAGLRQSFHMAGAKTVVSSIWPVPDRETALLMAVFYDGLAKGNSKGTALQAGQMAIINAYREQRKFPHPALWAAFNLTESGKLSDNN